MADNFASSDMFTNPNFDYRTILNQAATSQGMAPSYSAEQMATPPIGFQQQLDNAFGPGNSPYLSYDQRNATPAVSGVPRQSDLGGGGRRKGGGGGGGSNPYLSGMADDITRRIQEALGQGLNMIDANSIGVGGYGGDRQGIAQALAIARSNDNLAGQLTGMYGNQYNQDANRELQRYGMDQSNSTQRYGMDQNFYLGNQGQNQNFYTAQRGQDLQATAVGAQLFNQGNQGEWSGLNNANDIYKNYTGYGTSGNYSTGPDYAKGVGNGLAAYDFLNRPQSNSWNGTSNAGFFYGNGTGGS